jgi:hypothetical protein
MPLLCDPYRRKARERIERGPDGRARCVWCGGELPRRKKKYCCEKCADETLIRKVPGYARALVFERDNGICEGCGIDAAQVERALERVRGYAKQSALCEALARVAIDTARADGFKVGYRLCKTSGRVLWFTLNSAAFWEADHIKPVTEGGGCCGLENYRTLCAPCHKRETARLAARLAVERVYKKDAAAGQGRIF